MLIIKIQNGQPIDHPILLENFQQAFPNIDINNLPSDFAVFQRVQPPQLGVYEKNQYCRYELVDGVYKDVWYCEQLTDQEKIEKQNSIKQLWTNNNGPASWIFNETTCQFDPPVQYPDDGKQYSWDENTVNWVEITR